MSNGVESQPEGSSESASVAWPLRILILALIGNDGRLTAEFLSKAGLEAEVCRDVSDVCQKIEAGSAAMILAEETLDSKSIPALIETLERQPSWSNIPITIVTSGGESTQSRLRRLGAFGHARNVTILERPFRPSTLISTVEVALNARRRQYQVRDLLVNLQASEDHLKNILESISDGFAALDKSWSFTYVNNSFLQLISSLNVSADAVLSKNVWGVFPDIVGTDIERRFRRAMSEQRMEAFEMFYEPLNGWFDIRAYPSAGSLSIYLREITERKKAEAFSAIHARRGEMISTIAAELLLTNAPRTLLPSIFTRVATSVDAELYFNYMVSEDRRKLILESSAGITDSQRTAFSELAFEQALGGVSGERQTPLIINVQDCNLEAASQLHRVGMRAYVCHPLRVGDRLIGTISFATKLRDSFDVEELRFMATVSDLVASSLDRSRLISEVNAARDSAESANRAKDHFLATLSHELRTPLSPVLLVAEAAANDPKLPESVRSDFALLRKNVALEARLIDDLLDLTRVSQGRLEIERKACDIHSILQDAIRNVESDMQQKRISLTLDLQAKEHHTIGDSVRLQQIFWNVLKNAVKFTPERGQISVTTDVFSDKPDKISIRFTDTGVGMNTAELTSVFDAFSQGNHAEAGSISYRAGLGLGLFISRVLTEAHSGQIRAESAGLGHGTTLTIELPLLRVPLQKDESPRRTSARHHPASATALPHRRRILLVEDHEDTRVALASFLGLKYHVVTAASAAEARSHAKRESFDLVISDIGLPDETGYDLMAALQKDYGLKGIALTGYGMEGDLARSRRAGFFAHVTKPAGAESLEEVLAEVFAS